MWQVVYVDERVNEFESNIIWRTADLLGVSSRQRIELRQQVAVDRAAQQLVGQVAVLQTCFHGTGTDVRVSVWLKEGKILLEGTDEAAWPVRRTVPRRRGAVTPG